MTLLGNSVSMSVQEENEPFIWKERSKRSMIGKDHCFLRERRTLEMLLMPFILLYSMLCSPCSLVRTKFPNRVIHYALPGRRVARAGRNELGPYITRIIEVLRAVNMVC